MLLLGIVSWTHSEILQELPFNISKTARKTATVLSKLLQFKVALKKNGVKLISAMEPISDDPVGILVESMLEGNAEYYSADLSEKVNRGMTDNALKCKRNGGTLPLGYFIDHEKHFQIDPATAPIVLEIFTLYADGMSMNEIAEQMRVRGLLRHSGFVQMQIQLQNLR